MMFINLYVYIKFLAKPPVLPVIKSSSPDSDRLCAAISTSPSESRISHLSPLGSSRVDEGYHSHGSHDESNQPEELSDSDNENYVLDFR